MLLVNHRLAPSRIHGLGVFTQIDIIVGSIVWRYDPEFDVELPASLVMTLCNDDIDIIKNHAEYIPSLDVFRLGNDGDMFMNHSYNPTLLDNGDEMVAIDNLPAGTELTCDYSKVQVLGYVPVTQNE